MGSRECRIKSKWAGIYQGKLSFRATKCPKAGLRGRGQSPPPIPRPTPVATPPKKKAAYTEGGRKYIIKLRCTEEEKAKIKAIAKSCEMDVSELLRELINKHFAGIKIPTLRPVRRKRQFGRLYKAYKELNRIGVNINQIARGINIMAKGGRSHESFPEILCEIMSISNRLDVILDVALEEDGE